VKFEAVTRDVAETLGLQRISGALVSRVTPKSPAEAAGHYRGKEQVSAERKRMRAGRKRTHVHRSCARGAFYPY
jgi:S1-C subfamily serine protease